MTRARKIVRAVRVRSRSDVFSTSSDSEPPKPATRVLQQVARSEEEDVPKSQPVPSATIFTVVVHNYTGQTAHDRADIRVVGSFQSREQANLVAGAVAQSHYRPKESDTYIAREDGHLVVRNVVNGVTNWTYGHSLLSLSVDCRICTRATSPDERVEWIIRDIAQLLHSKTVHNSNKYSTTNSCRMKLLR